jgi:anti-sigma factor RsiW
MTPSLCPRVASAELADYWAGDLPEPDANAFEDHLFACEDCARQLSEIAALARGIRDTMRASGVAAVVTESVLNRLARDGVRVRSYVLDPGDHVPCAVWDDDDVMAVRLRGDFSGATSVTIVRTLPGGEELNRSDDVPLAAGQRDVIIATPAAWLRTLPAVEIAIAVTAETAGVPRTLGTYTLHHAGALNH